jgi:PKD repeat protein
MHKYLSAGNFTVRLTVTNSFGLQASATTSIRVDEPLVPNARFTAGPLSGRVPLQVTLDGSNSTDQNDPALGGSNLNWTWRLGNGTVLDPLAGAPSEGDVVVQRGPLAGPFEVTFNKPGVYVIEMIVTNGFGKTDTEIIDVRVSGPPPNQPPVAVIRATPRTGSGPLTVQLSADESFDPEGGLLDYTWNFGDGSQLVRGVSSVSHTYTREQTYNATLTVTDNSGQSDNAAIAIVVTDDQGSNNGSPIARIQTGDTQGAAPFRVLFDASSSSDPEGGALAYAWDFGDGSDTAFGAQVEHTFREARNYSVVLVVSDSQGNTGAANVTISVTMPSDDSGQQTPDVTTPTAPAPFCGGFGMFPVLLTLAGAIGVWRRLGGRTVR